MRAAGAIALLLVAGGARAQTNDTGVLSGTLTYPSEYIPAMRVYALSVDGAGHRMVATKQNQKRFTIGGLRPGDYHLVGYPQPQEGIPLPGVALTRCTKAPCSDHTLVAVTVAASKTVGGLVLGDWDVPAATLPPEPAADCERAGSQLERDGCHLAALQAADAGLNRNYQRALAALAKLPKCKQLLQAAQRAWLRYRDGHCAYERETGEKGRGVRCQRALTEQRAAYLAQLAVSERLDGDCHP